MEEKQRPVQWVEQAVLRLRDDGIATHHAGAPQREDAPPQPFCHVRPDVVELAEQSPPPWGKVYPAIQMGQKKSSVAPVSQTRGSQS
jgi:hypothetical protein